MAKKKTQTELLQELVDLLAPISNLARYQIGQINTALAAQAKAQEDGQSTES